MNTAIDRRAFVRGAAAAGVTAGLAGLGLLAAGCSTASASSNIVVTSGSLDDASSAAGSSSGGDSASAASVSTSLDAGASSAASRSLVVVFSRTGTTLEVAERIAELTGADLVRVEPSEPYTDNYDEMLDLAQEEYAQEARPAIATTIENWDDYDVVYLGSPVWWARLPRIMATLLETYDLAGKVVVAPFATSGSSSMSGWLEDVLDLCPDAPLVDGFLTHASEMPGSLDEDLPTWVSQVEASADEALTAGGEDGSVQTNTVSATFDGTAATIALEDNETAAALRELLPLELTMNELNGNEKFAYLDVSLPTSARNPGTITKGDVMLYGSSCLVVFYETFSTSYSYTRVGRIEDEAVLDAIVPLSSVGVTLA